MDAQRFDECVETQWSNPDLDVDGSSVVICDGRIVAFTLLVTDGARGIGSSGFTATLPEFRGRGLATRAKLLTLRWAAEHGIETVTTTNDDENPAMLAVNAKIGFVPFGKLVTYRREL